MTKPLRRSDPPEIVAKAEPARLIHKPKECEGGDECWVKVGRKGMVTDLPNQRSPRCKACGGKIR